jgi:hypothetical protein
LIEAVRALTTKDKLFAAIRNGGGAATQARGMIGRFTFDTEIDFFEGPGSG